MKLYSALIKKDAENKIDDVALVNDGLSISAFFFGAFWFLFHKMWHFAAIILAADFIISSSENFYIFNSAEIIFLHFAISVAIAFNANKLLVANLLKKNYQIIGFVFAKNKAEARIKAMRILQNENPNLSLAEFSNALLDLQMHKSSLKNKEEEPYF